MALLCGILLGFGISIPVGPVNIAVLLTTIREGKQSGISIGLGAALMDGFYMLVAVIGVHWINIHADLLKHASLIGAIVLMGLGLRELLARKSKIEAIGDSIEKDKKGNRGRYFTLGILFYITNPGFLLFFTSLAVWLNSSSFASVIGLDLNAAGSGGMAGIGVGLGSALWFVSFALVVDYFRKKMTVDVLHQMNKVAGGLFLILGLLLFIKCMV